MAVDDIILQEVSKGFSEVIHKIIGNTFITAYGIIKEIPSGGVVRVELSVSDAAENIVITDCTYVNLASKAFAIKVEPQIDDKVLVIFPKTFHNEMFNATKNEAIISEATKGYNILAGIAIPVNQVQAFHKNCIKFNKGAIDAKFAYNESQDKNNFEFSVSQDGDVSIKNPKVTVTADKEGVITVDNSKAEIKIDSSGNISIDAKAGKVTVKNSAANLFTILNNILTILNSGMAVTGAVPAGSAPVIVAPSLFTADAASLGNLMQ